MDKKLKNLNLKEKANVIKMVCEEKRSIREVTAHFKCGKTQIYNVIKQKHKIMERYLSSSKTGLVRIKERDTKYCELNRIVFEWFSAARAKNFPVSGPVLQQKAKEIAEMLRLDGFSASNGWLQSFRKRHSISFHNSFGKGNEVDEDAAKSWHDRLTEIICRYDAKYVANASETNGSLGILPKSNSVQNSVGERSTENHKKLNTCTLEQLLDYINAIELYAKMKAERNLYEKALDLKSSFDRTRKCVLNKTDEIRQ